MPVIPSKPFSEFPADNLPIEKIPFDKIPDKALERLPFSIQALDLDVLVVGFNLPIWLLENEGDLTFAKSEVPGGPLRAYDVVAGDLDGDGDLDAIIGHASAYPYRNMILLNNGDGSFESSFGPAFAYSTNGLALGDFDGDGDLDAMLAQTVGGGLMINNGDGTFSSSTYSTAGQNFNQKIAIGDLDGDGDMDAIVASWSGNTIHE